MSNERREAAIEAAIRAVAKALVGPTLPTRVTPNDSSHAQAAIAALEALGWHSPEQDGFGPCPRCGYEYNLRVCTKCGYVLSEQPQGDEREALTRKLEGVRDTLDALGVGGDNPQVGSNVWHARGARARVDEVLAALATPSNPPTDDDLNELIEMPRDLVAVLSDPSIIIKQDAAVFELLAKWQRAPTTTASESSAAPSNPGEPRGCHEKRPPRLI